MDEDEVEADRFIRASLEVLTLEEYVFTVECLGTAWDVYCIQRGGRTWTTAFRVRNDAQLEVGIFTPGVLTVDEVGRLLSQN